MKKLIFPICLILFGVLLSGCGAGRADGEKTYVVATDNSFVPFEFLNKETGKVQGFDIDLIKAIAEEAGFKIDIKPMKFTGVMAGLESGRYDIGIAGITITEERDKVIDFSDPYYEAGLIIAVQEDTTNIQIPEDLAGKKVGTRTGTTSHTYIKNNIPEAKLYTYESIVQAYQDLQAGRLDAVMYDAPNVKYYIKTKAEGEIKTVGDILQGENYGVAFPEGSELVDDVNQALATLKENGTYEKIYKKWFGEPPQ